VKLAMFVNDIATEQPVYTTTRLAVGAVARDHEVWYIGAGDFALEADRSLTAKAWHAPRGVSDPESFLDGAPDAPRERIAVDDLDVLLLRNDPADDVPDRHWAQTAGVLFGERAADRGVLVLNDPVGLSRALTKLYLDSFPADISPATLVTRDTDDVRSFVEAHGGRAVLKPLQGSKGHGVFVVNPDDEVNLDQMVDALTRDGYLIAQEYVPEATDGDVRLFLIDGEPLRVDGAHAAFRRVPAEGEARANMDAGATAEPAVIDDRILGIAERVGPRLAKDGVFLAGLDIVGSHVLEINVFSPGGLGSAQGMTGVDFVPAIIEALEARCSAR
jgi:glutathione synthase